MWLMTDKGFFSVVKHRTRSGYLLVRCRVEEHAKWVQRQYNSSGSGPKIRVQRISDADYEYRVVVPAVWFSYLMLTQIEGIDYDNFKNHCQDVLSKGERANRYLAFLHEVWWRGVGLLTRKID